MDEKDPPPFGYTFPPNSFFNTSPTIDNSNSGTNLLTEYEDQSLQDFFSQDPFISDAPVFPPATDTKDGLDDLSNWNFVPPATIHRVSTTIPDQTQFQHRFHNDQNFASPSFPTPQLGSTHDDLQAASTLFNNAQAAHSNGRSYSFHGIPSSNNHVNGHGTTGPHGVPLVPTSTGMLNEQLAAVLPNHTEDGSIDAQLAAQFAISPAHQQHQQHKPNLTQIETQRPALKRSYTYGTDSAFDPSGFIVSSPNDTHEHVSQRLIQELRYAQGRMDQSAKEEQDAKLASPSVHNHFPSGLVDIPSDNDEQLEEGTSDEDEDGGDRPAKKRRKSKNSATIKNGRSGNSRKSISGARSGKNRKASIDEQAGKKKRLSSAGQKLQRENLTEEQKRSNHILSEQKRRNLIKRGFDDLHELVPEIRNGGLSKSSVLTEAANFLDKLIEDNANFLQLSASADG